MIAELICIGTELLLGDILNTNVRFLSRELANLGIDIYYQVVVGDNRNRVMESYRQGFERADLIIASGGLGPTEDDVTKEAAADFFGLSLYEDKEVMDSLKNYFQKMGVELCSNNLKQALVPEGAMVIKNDKGTAPGLMIEKDGKTLILLPGPPVEMEHMFKTFVLPLLQSRQNYMFVSRVLRLCGIGESNAASELEELIHGQTNPTIAPYANLGDLLFRITAKAKTKAEAEKMIDPIAGQIYAKLGSYVYAEGEDATLEGIVIQLLKEKALTIALAESCTGGLLAGRITNVPGVSDVLIESSVTYSNEAKMRRLGVKKETLDCFGAVSKETAEEMAVGICKTSGADVGIAVTGIAGPDGGTIEKPVGLVYLGFCLKGKIFVEQLNLTGDRQRIRAYTVIRALDRLRRMLLNESTDFQSKSL